MQVFYIPITPNADKQHWLGYIVNVQYAKLTAEQT